MNDTQLYELAVLEAIERLEPLAAGELEAELRLTLPGLGFPAHKVDRVLVARALAGFTRQEPPLVAGEIPGSEVDGYGRALPGARSRFELTDAGEQRLEALRRAS